MSADPPDDGAGTPDRAPTVVEPADDHRVEGRRVVLALAAAGLLAVLAAVMAPAAWPDGPGALVVQAAGQAVLDEPVAIGDPTPVAASEGGWTVSLPDGIPTDGLIAATLSRQGGPIGDDVRVHLRLADGREELIPPLRTDDEGVLHLQRRPSSDAAIVLGLLAFVVVFWVTEAVALWTTSLIVPFVLAATEVMAPGSALAPFFHPIIVLFFAGFLMAEAMRRVGLDHLAAVWLVARLGRSPATLFGALLGVSAFLSMWMSNTAAVAVLLPIVLAVAAPLGDRAVTRMFVLGVAYAATIGGVGSAIGTPANPIAMEFLSRAGGRDLSFADWFAYGLPMVVLFLPIMAVVLWRRERVSIDPAAFSAARAVATDQAHVAGRLDRDQVKVLVVFVALALAWLTEGWHGISAGIVALGGAIVLSSLGLVRTDDLGRISWSSLLTFGGGLTLGIALTDSGASDWVATRLAGLGDLPSIVGIAVVAVVTLAGTTVASNTATAATFVPLAIPMAGILGVEPALLVPVVAIASSVDFALVIGTPPTMLAYSTGLFSVRDILRAGIVLDVMGLALLVLLLPPIWGVLGVA